MRKIIFFILFSCLSLFNYAQNNTQQNQRLKIYIDCSNTWCDMKFIKTEINLVDFLLDNKAADLHILITDQRTGGGGRQYQLIFFGQNQFKSKTDTLRFNTDPNGTEFENRDQLIKYLKLGLAPFVAKTNAVKDVSIELKSKGTETGTIEEKKSATKDPWNYWVFRTGIFGRINAEESIHESSFNGNISVNRVTEELKLGFDFNVGKNKTVFDYEDSTSQIVKDISRNENYNFSHYLVKSINDHWSWGYEASLSSNTRSNNKRRTALRTGIEYNIFPYKEVNTKYFTIRYIFDIRYNAYIDSTLFDKTKETLIGHGIETKLTFNQKWGTIESGLEYHNYFHKWKFLNLEAYLQLEIRITGGLSFNIYTYGELIRDQIYLPKAGATLQEILTRRRELASGYRYGTNFGINYRFGSKLNNFVNPRFD